MAIPKISTINIGPVELNVNNLAFMRNFYSDILKLKIISESKSSVTLGKNNKPLITLHEREDLPPASHREAGLYHFAILFSSRKDLAETIHHILKNAPEHFSGSGDHLVSEAFYFYDPERNGIELYFDRDRTEWQWEKGQIKMATLYIDPVKYIQSNLVLEDTNTEVEMGHIHLKVGDIAKAKAFYVNILGFEVTAELPGALFVSVGGYHHHIGMNTWESLEAEERYDSLGLNRFDLILPEKVEFESIKESLKKNNINFQEETEYIQFFDPWKNQIRISFQ